MKNTFFTFLILRKTADAGDDGNNVSGDGCSATCSVEPGGLPRLQDSEALNPKLNKMM